MAMCAVHSVLPSEALDGVGAVWLTRGRSGRQWEVWDVWQTTCLVYICICIYFTCVFYTLF